MTNAECPNDEGMTKSECQNLMRRARFLFEHWIFVRHLSFVIACSFGLIRVNWRDSRVKKSPQDVSLASMQLCRTRHPCWVDINPAFWNYDSCPVPQITWHLRLQKPRPP